MHLLIGVPYCIFDKRDDQILVNALQCGIYHSTTGRNATDDEGCDA